MPRIYTIGYEGMHLGEFIAGLRARGVARLVDVRAIAFSRKKGFSKTALSCALNAAGIEYLHMPELGSPKELREELYKNSDYERFFRKYSKHLAGKEESLCRLRGIADEKTSALMCFERDSGKCHRGIIASELLRNGAEVTHI
ncbi:MAG: DUF488 domain-containing protein [Candidatus Diapherotrites archaeon]